VFDFLPTESSSSDDGNHVPISVGVVTGRRPRQLVPFAVLTRLVDAGGSGSSSRRDLAAEHRHRARVRSETDRAVAGSFGLRTSEGRAGLPNRSRHVTALVVPTRLSPRPSGLGDHSKLSFMPYPSPGTSSFSLWSISGSGRPVWPVHCSRRGTPGSGELGWQSARLSSASSGQRRLGYRDRTAGFHATTAQRQRDD
jgi:hypothetical protein